MSMDMEEQYDRLYRYCYFKVRQRETAEDITQEAFLRFLESSHYVNTGKAMQYLYTIARHLCVDESRRRRTDVLDEEAADEGACTEDRLLTGISVRAALAKLEETDRELLLLRYVNEVPVSVIAGLIGISRFAAYRRISQAAKRLREQLGKEDIS